MEDPGDRKSHFGDLYYNNIYVVITQSFLGVSYATRIIYYLPSGYN